MEDIQTAFQIDLCDNVATALTALHEGLVTVRGDFVKEKVNAVEDIPIGHKIAICDIPKDGYIIKYGVNIGCATEDILKGSWVHLHCFHSMYDERSSHLDVITGAPKDISYE